MRKYGGLVGLLVGCKVEGVFGDGDRPGNGALQLCSEDGDECLIKADDGQVGQFLQFGEVLLIPVVPHAM